MATLTLDLDNITKATNLALQEGAKVLEGEILKITPRDPKRMPLDPSQPTTGALRRSIHHERVTSTHYKVGVVGAGISGQEETTKGAAPSEYGAYLEFGTSKMKPRSYIRKAYAENKDMIESVINKVFRKYIT